ncbi:MAG: acyltransferase, partial [Roseibacillus sp.]|nr:acyltransferase [Roseibacillus sp.]
MDQEFRHLRGSFSYRPDIDGLRAIAVLPVLFFHMGLGCSGGYVGVDIFFVISGYLITSLIIREMLNDEFTLRAFWERRIRRIFPVAALVTIIVITAGVWILLPDTFRSLGKAGIAQVMMVANFYFWQQDGYFAGPSDLEPLLHMWSLAVEEQFYFLFPMLLLFLMKRGQKTTVWVIILISILSLLLSFHGVIYDKGTTFYLLPARAWELALGALVALLPLRSIGAAWRRQLVALAGLALILWSVFAYDVATPFPGLAAIPPCLGTALLIWVGQSGTTWVGGLLAQRPIVYIGKISFSLYLWHWPLIVYARHLSIYEISLNVRVTLLVASLLLAVLSYQFVETPFRRKRIVAKRRQVFKLFGCMSGAMVVAFAAIYFLDGIPQRFRGDTVRFAEISMEIPDDPDINP